MAKPDFITSLDIGTSTVKALVVQQNPNSELQTIAFFEKPVSGIRRGIVINVQEVAKALGDVQEEMEIQTGQKINSAYINIGGSHIFCTFSEGKVAVSRADQEVSEEDIDRVLEDAKTFFLSPNKEILCVFPRNFIVDGEKVKEAVGMKGVRLEVEALVVCVFSPYFKNLEQSILNSGFQTTNDIIPSPIAAARAVLSSRQKELGVALLDIGEGTSSLAVFEEGSLIHLTVLPIGSANITHDIAIGLRTDIDIAERIKKEFGSCLVSEKEKREKVEIKEPEPLVFTRKILNNIIEARVSQIFEEMNKELKKISKDSLLPAGIVLTGGGAKLPGIVRLAKRELRLPCKIGRPHGFVGLDKDPGLATVCGLTLMGLDLEGAESSPSMVGEAVSRVKNFFKSLIP